MDTASISKLVELTSITKLGYVEKRESRMMTETKLMHKPVVFLVQINSLTAPMEQCR